jgi:ribulose-bisphosphate carboxylase large chain
MSYIMLGSGPGTDEIVCDFILEPSGGVSIRKAAEYVAAESSVGTWTEVHSEKGYMRGLAARVFRIRKNSIRIAYPGELFEKGNIPQILSSVAGNVFGMKSVKNLKLMDISFPPGLVKSFPGPAYGIPGVRKVLGVRERPLLGTIVKPKLGLRATDHSRVAYDAWLGGCDIVKDDENLTSQGFNPFRERVMKTLEMRDRAEQETGERKAYMPNVTAESREMLRRAEFVQEHGGRYVMLDILTSGFSGLQSLREAGFRLIIHAHRAMHAAFTRNPKHGISMLVLAKLARLAGVDQIHIGTIVGKMEGGREEVQDVEDDIEDSFVAEDGHVLAQKWYGLKPVFAVASGGLHPGHVPKLVEYLGKDIIIQMGGGIHGHPKGTKAGAMAARQAVDLALQGLPFEEIGGGYGELGLVMKKWNG